MLADTCYPRDLGRKHWGGLWVKSPHCSLVRGTETGPPSAEGCILRRMHYKQQAALGLAQPWERDVDILLLGHLELGSLIPTGDARSPSCHLS